MPPPGGWIADKLKACVRICYILTFIRIKHNTRIVMSQHSVYINDDELLDWMEEKVENGPYNNTSHLVRQALRRMKKDDKGQPMI